MSTLEIAISIAALAHAGQVDKAGAPYILHPIRVMQRLTTDEQRIVGVLHDVLEDTRVVRCDLAASGFGTNILNALDFVTRLSGESYRDFIIRAAQNPIGRAVKLSDLEDNQDIGRISSPTDADRRRSDKYLGAILLIANLSLPTP